MALDTRGLAAGFGQGFGLADQYYARQHQQELQTKQNERANRRMEMAETQFSGQQEDAQRKRSQEQAQFTLGKIAQGVELSQEEMTFLKENPQYWPALDPETDAAIENAQRVIDPDDPLDSNDPEALYSMNLMFGSRVNRGEGGKKRIAGIYPGRGEGTVAIDLEVEGEDGKKYNAPMTRNRGVAGADDEVLETDVGSLVDQVQGYRMLRNAFQGPEAQQSAARVLAALTGKTPEPTKGININGFLVDPTQGGEPMGDYRTADQRQGGQANKLTPEQDADLKRIGTRFQALQKLEYAIMTNQLDGQETGIPGLGTMTITSENRDQVLNYLQTEKQNNEREYNRILGRTEPQGAEHQLITRARELPEDQRAGYVETLASDPRIPPIIVQQVKDLYGMTDPASAADNEPATMPAPEAKPQPEPRPDPALQQPPGLTEKQSPVGQESPTQTIGLQGPSEFVEPFPERPTNPMDEGKLGPKIESGARAVGNAVAKRADKNVNKTTRELSQIARGEREPHQGNIKQMLTNNPEAIKRLSPADVDRLKAKYGERFINQFLQQ